MRALRDSKEIMATFTELPAGSFVPSPWATAFSLTLLVPPSSPTSLDEVSANTSQASTSFPRASKRTARQQPHNRWKRPPTISKPHPRENADRDAHDDYHQNKSRNNTVAGTALGGRATIRTGEQPHHSPRHLCSRPAVLTEFAYCTSITVAASERLLDVRRSCAPR